MLVSPVLAVCASTYHGLNYLIAYTIFIAISRMFLSLFLFQYSRKIQMSYPCILYFNQLINAAVKVYCIFRLSKQRWSNRGDQKSDVDGGYLLDLARNTMANWCTAIAVILLFLMTLQFANIITAPSFELFAHVFGELL